jgi:hypothetical protein
MKVSGEPNQQENPEAMVQRSVRMALILTVSVFGLAAAYFGAVYLIAR